MADTRPFASLSSGLLARKGGAKPAMRPQGFGSFGGSLEDLGWNDMGSSPVPEHVPSSVEALTPSPIPSAAPEPPVVEQQRSLRTAYSAPVQAEVVPLPRSRAFPGKDKAAFTLRLDPERHLKLRLACALTRRSAQQLVTEALDDFLNSQPEVEVLATRVPAEAGRR